MANKYDKDSIVVIKNDRDRVRQSPNMYIPNRGKTGYLHTCGEIWDNSFDEVVIPGSVGNNIAITFDVKTRELTVTDDGRGIPHEKLYDALTVLAASGKFNNGEDNAYVTSGGSFGHGMTVSLALSKSFKCISTRDGKMLGYEFVDGLKTNEIKGKAKGHGTTTSMILDPKFVDGSEVTPDDINDRLEEKSYIFPGVNITFTVLSNGKEVKTKRYGGKTIVDRVKKWKLSTDIIEIHDSRKVTFLRNVSDDNLTTEKVKIDLAFGFSEDALDDDNDKYTISYCNTIKTYEGGMHTDGVKAGIQKWFKDLIIPNLKGKDKDLQIVPMDMVSGLCQFTVVSLSAPEFRGQEKTQLSNPEVKTAVRDAVYEALKGSKTSVTNPIIDFIKRVARGRLASKKTRKKDVGNVFSKDHLDKFIDITYNMNTDSPEIILVEGDSAENCAATARDPNNQALYSVKKPTNIYDEDSDTLSKTTTVFNDILDICGIEAGKKCDPEKSTMKRILMLTDGDVDGDSIAISVMCLLAKHCKPLIDVGMVGRILPPAYAIPTGKNGKRIYVHTQREFFNIIMKKFVKDTTVKHHGKELSKNELYELLSVNFVYDTKLDKLANRYCCEPKFMEYVAWKYHGDNTTQKKSYWMSALKTYEDIHVIMEHGMIIIDGDLKGYDHINLPFDEYFDRNVQRFKKVQSRNDDIYGYEINGEKDKSLYDVMTRMRKYVPDGVQRFKGLGELEPKELKELCMDRDKRNVVIMKFGDYDKDMEKINIIMSTKQQYVDARNKILRNTYLSDLDLDT